MTGGDTLIAPQRMTGRKVTTPVMHGFALTLENDQTVDIDRLKTGWKTGSSNYVVEAGFNSAFGQGALALGVNYPATSRSVSPPRAGGIALPRSSFPSPIPPTDRKEFTRIRTASRSCL
jgi:hypothetical protein